MNILQDLTPHLLTLYHALDPYLRGGRALLAGLQTQLAPVLLPLLNRAAVVAQDAPALVTVAALLLLFAISLQLLNLARRVLLFWTRMLFRIAVYGALVVLAMLVWQRGLGRTAGDLMAWAAEIQQVWLMEYQRWEGYQNQGRGAARGSHPGAYNVRAGNARTGWR